VIPGKDVEGRWRRYCEAALLGAAALLFLFGLGGTDFWEPDEPRHGAIAEEMRALAHGPAQLALPRLNGEVYTQKPPLYYWLAVLAGLPAGHVTESAARAPSALAGIGMVLLAMRLGREALGGLAGVAAGAVLLTLPAFVDLGRSARPDALLAFFVTAALLFAWRVDRGLGSPARSRWLLHLSMGIGVLAKGPVAVLLPLFGLLAYLAWERRLRDLGRFVSAPALAASLLPGLVWISLASALAPSGFVKEAVGENVLLRFFTGTDHARSPFFYLVDFPGSFLPWSLAWPFAAWTGRGALKRSAGGTRASAVRFLVAFVGAGLVFFSLSKGKRDAYLLPLYPAAALLVGCAVQAWIRPRLVTPASSRKPSPSAWAAVAAVGVAVALELAYMTVYLPRQNSEHSIRPTATAAAGLAPPGTPIGLYRNGALIGGVAYYAGRPVEEIGSTKGLRRFFGAGGGVVVLEAEHLGDLEAVASTRIAFRQTLDGDEMLVVVPGGER
jgi:4-amino-4-deoxy-L-arabinose transferase-like glycosyltransferase